MSSDDPPQPGLVTGVVRFHNLMDSPFQDAKALKIEELEALVPHRPVLNLDHSHPRIPVTPSMLYTYAHMQGLGKHPDHGKDILHSALFPGRSRRFFHHRIWLPLVVENVVPIEELPRGALYFWDPVTHVDSAQELGIPEKVAIGKHRVRASPPPKSYQEYTLRHPPIIGNHQYKGDEVYANFGYLHIGDHWVDPDSEMELYEAYINNKSATYRQPGLPYFQRSPPRGNGIMNGVEEDEFYRDYVNYVTDEIDGEDDPRQWRISPQTFARWASGAVLGETYEENAVPPTLRTKLPKTPVSVWNTRTPCRKIKAKMQFDFETGSVFTGAYDVEDEPAMLEDSEGVDILRPPAHLALMDPRLARDMRDEAFGGKAQNVNTYPAHHDHAPHNHDPESLEVRPPSHEILYFDDHDGPAMLEHSAFPGTGVREFCSSKALIWSLDQTVQGVQDELRSHVEARNQKEFERHRLQEETQFLNARVRVQRGMPHPFTITKSPYDWEMNGEEVESDHDDMPLDEPPSPGVLREREKRRRYRRVIGEMVMDRSMLVTTGLAQQVRIKEELDEILADIEDLKRLRENMFAELGVQSIEDIPGLIPRRRVARRDLRALFGQSKMKEIEGPQ